MLDALRIATLQTAVTFAHTWPYLAAGAMLAAAFALYVDQSMVSAFLRRHRGSAVLLATLVAVATPLCSCGTMAVILGMLATSVPWAPIVAFMVASPLTSPAELVYSAGLFGWPFALAFFASSIALGLAGGAVAHVLESRGLLAGQVRFQVASTANAEAAGRRRPSLRDLAQTTLVSSRRIVLLFFSFAFLGYFINALVPPAWVGAVFGDGARWGVPLAGLFGLPFYVNTEASLPLVRAFLDNGASAGAALAFLITGAGTSLGAMAGALSIARWRVVGLVVATLLVGSVVIGVSYNAVQSAPRPAAAPTTATARLTAAQLSELRPPQERRR